MPTQGSGRKEGGVCKYSDKILPNNFEEVGLIIDEYKKFKIVTDDLSLKLSKKSKPILVKGENLEKEFESITDTVKYFKTLNIQLDRKTLNNRLKDGKIYKDYYFSYKSKIKVDLFRIMLYYEVSTLIYVY